MTLLGDSRSMAVGTLLRCRCVEENQPSSDFLSGFVAAGARNILVRASEFESGFIVIEAGRTPEASLVASGAIAGFPREGAKLANVDVFVAPGTLSGRFSIADPLQSRRDGSGAMALIAGNAFVGTGQGEAGCGMIERLNITPRTHGVARFAARSPLCPVLWPLFRQRDAHPVGKLAPMRIEVARFAGYIGEMVCRRVSTVRQDLVALATTDSCVPAL